MATPILLPVDRAGFRRQAWRNGAGSTLELARSDENAWRWRVSVASLQDDAPFSVVAGARRQFAPLDQPLRLRFDDGRMLDVKRLQVIHFDGADAPSCTLTEGPGRAFNLMLRDDAEGTLITRPLLGTMYLPALASARWMVYMATGRTRLSSADVELDLDAGDAAWAMPVSGQRVLIEGAGDLVLVQLPID